MRQLTIIFAILLVTSQIVAQRNVSINISDVDYQALKANGELRPNTNYNITLTKVPEGVNISTKSFERAGECGCYEPHDATYTLAMAPNDDGSSPNIPIPFNFCLYGINYTSLWINNNGNVTFDNFLSGFNAVGFPDPTYVMVAPFWADIDTRPAGLGGEVWYKVTPTSVTITWENCGYYYEHYDKKNTFSLIITDGSDAQIGVGNNVAFCYADMQWTTGDASMGVGGFGGTAATVGCNKGDGTAFVQFGRFDTSGTDYIGPYSTDNGVSWLDNQSFVFDACNSTNISPALAGGVSLCDTLFNCEADTLIDTLTFLSPEAGQITTLSASSASPDFSVLSITNGNIATIIYQVIGNTPGTISYTINATDNGTPVQSKDFTFNVFVAPLNAVTDPIISGDTLLCPGHIPILEVVNAVYDSIFWNTGSVVNTTTAPTSGYYIVEGYQGACSRMDSIYINAIPGPEIYILDSLQCSGSSVTFNSSAPNDVITNYNWNFGLGMPSSSSDPTPVVTFPGYGDFPVTLTVTNDLGCNSTVNETMSILQGPNANFVAYPVCISRFIFDPYGSNDSIWVIDWYFGDGTSLLDVDSTSLDHIFQSTGTYMVEMWATDNTGCTDSASVQVVVFDTLSIQMPNVLIHSSTQGNNKFDMEFIKPDFNLCVDYTFTIYDRWGIMVFETQNDPYNPDLFCNHCFSGKSSTGSTLSPGVYFYLLKGNYGVEDHGTITIFD